MDLPEKYKFPISHQGEKPQLYNRRCVTYLKNNFGTELGTKLYKMFVNYMKNLMSEILMNNALKQIQTKCDQQNINISCITKLDGNCLFESIISTGVCGNISIIELRKGIAFIMKTFKNMKNFFPTEESSLCELFDILNSGDAEVKHVIQDNDKQKIEYTYEIMCNDLCVLTSWCRLPTEIILMVISFLYKLKIIIINDKDSNWESVINVWDNTILPETSITTIYLGHVTECHYVALKINNNNNNIIDNNVDKNVDITYYNESAIKLSTFIKNIETHLFGKLNK